MRQCQPLLKGNFQEEVKSWFTYRYLSEYDDFILLIGGVQADIIIGSQEKPKTAQIWTREMSRRIASKDKNVFFPIGWE